MPEPLRLLWTLMAATLVAAPLAAQDIRGPTGGEAAVAHFDSVRQAQALFDAGRFDAAEPLLARLVHRTPHDGSLWWLLARSRHRLGDVTGAIAAYRSTWHLGTRSRATTAYHMARLFAGLGDADSTFTWLEHALVERWGNRPGIVDDTMFSRYRADPRFARITGIPVQPPASRVEGWRGDIDYLLAEARRLHAAPGRPAYSAAFDSAATSLKARVEALSDDRMVLELAGLLTLLGDGHSGIYGPGPETPLQLEAGSLPLRFHEFADGLYVTDGVGEERRWVGAQVVRFGGVPAGEVLAVLPRYMHHDNAMGVKWLGVRYTLPSLTFLHAVGATDDPRSVTLTLRTAEGTVRRVEFHGGRHGMAFPAALRAPPGAARVPLYLAQPDSNYRLVPLPESDAVYLQFSQVRDRVGGPTIAQFSDSLRQTLVATGARHLIIDVRLNNGGNNTLLDPLVRTLVWWEATDPGHRIFVITGRGTFSAAQNFINRVERHTGATFVGEPSSSRPNFTGEETTLVLPWSRVMGSISNRYWQDSDPGDDRPFIVPDIPIALTSADYFAGRDPALEAIAAMIDAAARAR